MVLTSALIRIGQLAHAERNRMNWIGELFGFLGGALGVSQALPQAIRIRRLGHGYGVSLVMWLATLLVNASWLGYGLMLHSPSIIISNAVAFITSSLVVAALLNRGWLAWPVMFAAGGFWLFLELQVSFNVITGFLVALTLYRLPQLIKSVRNLRAGKPTAVSLPGLLVGLGAICSWMVYSVLSGKSQLILTTGTAMAMTLTIVTLELITLRIAKQAQIATI